ncbi:hypothetical protein Tco_1510270 [Tanacetum coccineum]
MKSLNLNSQERELQQMLEEKVYHYFKISTGHYSSGKVDMGKALGVSLVVTESSDTKLEKKIQDLGMMQMLIKQISDLYMMKRQRVRYN